MFSICIVVDVVAFISLFFFDFGYHLLDRLSNDLLNFANFCEMNLEISIFRSFLLSAQVD
jgi:hypothetical protein